MRKLSKVRSGVAVALTIFVSFGCAQEQAPGPTKVVIPDSGAMDDIRGFADIVDSGTEPEPGADIVELVLDEGPAVPEDEGAVVAEPDATQFEAKPGGFLWPCENPGDCDSGFCIDIGGDLKCTIICQESCPLSGYGCFPSVQGGIDTLFICAPVYDEICSPCYEDEDCVGVADTGARCLDFGEEGRFCGGGCDENEDCPSGYSCDLVTLESGLQEQQCTPNSLPCACSTSAIEAGRSTTCFNENVYGRCEGTRKCMASGLTECSALNPGSEECNGEDDDCDGASDEDLVEYDSCPLTNTFGTCSGLKSCVDGVNLCEGEKAQYDGCDGLDNDCDAKIDEGFPDQDSDLEADCVDLDVDGDEIFNDVDNCKNDWNPAQSDLDDNGVGDACDPDVDGDSVPNQSDCMPEDASINPFMPELCDGIDNNCSGVADEGFADSDKDSVADCIDADDDNDGLLDDGDGSGSNLDALCKDGEQVNCDDNCPTISNVGQQDMDGDGVGDACDPDVDGDSWPAPEDCSPYNPAIHPQQPDICDGVDNNCEGGTDEAYPNFDGDGLADCVDEDDDNDGVPEDGDGSGDVTDSPCNTGSTQNCDDNCLQLANPAQSDNDDDGLGDLCDVDDDNDGTPDELDNCPYVANDQSNYDGDTLGDACDLDSDADGSPDTEDCAPLNPAVNPGVFELCDGLDNDCSGVVDDGYSNSDGDNLSDCIDPDDDNDSVLDDGDGSGLVGDNRCQNGEIAACDDNCTFVPNYDQSDNDGDGRGDACDLDDDNDGVLDDGDLTGSNTDKPCTTYQTVNCDDNCPMQQNANQKDRDGDGQGDACDPDDDNDGTQDVGDNCPFIANDQVDTDGDGDGNACDTDDDDDGVPDILDNCPLDPNPGFPQLDTDLDAFGNACDPDDDGDNVLDDGDNSLVDGDAPCALGKKSGCDDNCPLNYNPFQEDSEGDGIGDVCDTDDDNDGSPDALDNCPNVSNPFQENQDGDGLGDACDDDSDNDGVPDGIDNCPLSANQGQFDFDSDGSGDLCDPDDDDDGILDDGDGSGAVGDQKCNGSNQTLCDDNCPLASNQDQLDNDGDGFGDACDSDDDNDQREDDDDNCPLLANYGQEDVDGDGKGDACDVDDDGDNISDDFDNCPQVSNSDQSNVDGDTYGDACDPDRDDDGWLNADDCFPLDPQRNPDAVDFVDDAFVDANCDGIDGDAASSVFVDAVTGSDAALGTRQAPAKSIAKALSLAKIQNKPRILVSEGTYVEPVELVDGVSIYGGYRAADGWSRSFDELPVLEVQEVGERGLVALSGESLVLPIDVQGLSIRTADLSADDGVANIAIFLRDVQQINLAHLEVEAGAASDGQIGASGIDGAVAADPASANGLSGDPAFADSSVFSGGGNGGQSSCGTYGGPGGDGGYGNSAGQPGVAGAGGCSGTVSTTDTSCPGPGGSSGCSNVGAEGIGGADGLRGSHGLSGSSVVIKNGIPSAAPASAGQDGELGDGGGGGGGGSGGPSCNPSCSPNCDNPDGTCACVADRGAGGGGGGAGGCPGTGGAAGQAGGWSIGILAVDARLSALEVSVQSGDGGDGGKGGDGGAGQPMWTCAGTDSCPHGFSCGVDGKCRASGGKGGSAAGDGGAGGDGGDGGRGGDGGAGAGGSGGSSFAIYVYGVSELEIDQDTVDLNAGNAGAAGAGGNSVFGVAPSGSAGTFGALGP